MIYYRRYVADYQGKTARLSLLEHGAYCVMLDYYYADEEQLPADREEIYTMVRAMKPTDKAAVDKVLARHFELQDDGWHNKRADEEIDVSKKARANGKNGGRPPKTKGVTDDDPEDETECVTGMETETITGSETGIITTCRTDNGTDSATGLGHPLNHSTTQPFSLSAAQPPRPPKPLAKPKAAPNGAPGWLPLEAWNEYEAMRVKKRKPMTQGAKERIWKRLGGFRVDGHDVEGLLLRSADMGWTDVYPQDALPTEIEKWWTSDATMLAKANEMGISSRGLSSQQLRQKINEKVKNHG